MPSSSGVAAVFLEATVMIPIPTPRAGHRPRGPLMTAALVAVIAIVAMTAVHSSVGAQPAVNAASAGSQQIANPAVAVASSTPTAAPASTSASPTPTEAAAKATPAAATVVTTSAEKPAAMTTPATAAPKSASGPTRSSAASAPAAAKAAAPRPNQPTKDSAAQPVVAQKSAAQGSSGNWMTDLIPKVDPNGRAEWVFERNGGWGASDGHTIYIDPDMPVQNRYSVMVHEYGHVMQARAFGSLSASAAAMSAIVGDDPSSITANESTADCMAQILGATWVGYGCNDALRGAAAAVLAGQRP